jgi:hypothetical protein
MARSRGLGDVYKRQEEHDADKYFMEYSSYYGRDDDALRDILSEVREAMGARSFKEVMKAHDAALKAT